MTQPVFQSLLVDHIWMLLLFQRMFGEGRALIILYLIVNHLHDASLVLEDFFQLVQDFANNQTNK